MEETRNPTFAEVQAFFNAEYAFIKKWLAVKEPSWDEVLAESRDLENKHGYKDEDGNYHPFRYCLDRIVSTVELIERLYMEKKQAENNLKSYMEGSNNNVKD